MTYNEAMKNLTLEIKKTCKPQLFKWDISNINKQKWTFIKYNFWRY
jgi:hypothetical protein